MDFDLNREEEDFRKRVRNFTEREIAPLVDEAKEKEAFPIHLFAKMGKEGLLCVRCPQQYGGPGLSKVSECLYMEELNRVYPGTAAALMVPTSIWDYWHPKARFPGCGGACDAASYARKTSSA